MGRRGLKKIKKREEGMKIENRERGEETRTKDWTKMRVKGRIIAEKQRRGRRKKENKHGRKSG